MHRNSRESVLDAIHNEQKACASCEVLEESPDLSSLTPPSSQNGVGGQQRGLSNIAGKQGSEDPRLNRKKTVHRSGSVLAAV